MVERRDNVRRSIHIPATLSFDGLDDVVHGLITDASEGGVQIVIEPLEPLPEIDLNIAATLTLHSGEVVKAVVIWRENAAIGLKLMDAAPVLKKLPSLW